MVLENDTAFVSVLSAALFAVVVAQALALMSRLHRSSLAAAGGKAGKSSFIYGPWPVVITRVIAMGLFALVADSSVEGRHWTTRITLVTGFVLANLPTILYHAHAIRRVLLCGCSTGYAKQGNGDSDDDDDGGGESHEHAWLATLQVVGYICVTGVLAEYGTWLAVAAGVSSVVGHFFLHFYLTLKHRPARCEAFVQTLLAAIDLAGWSLYARLFVVARD